MALAWRVCSGGFRAGLAEEGLPLMEMDKPWSLSRSQWSPVTPGSFWQERKALSLMVADGGWGGVGWATPRALVRAPQTQTQVSSAPALVPDALTAVPVLSCLEAFMMLVRPPAPHPIRAMSLICHSIVWALCVGSGFEFPANEAGLEHGSPPVLWNGTKHVAALVTRCFRWPGGPLPYVCQPGLRQLGPSGCRLMEGGCVR